MRGRRWIAAAALALCLLTPASAPAADEEFEGVTSAFRLKGSNGYRFLVIASSRHADGRGELVILVRGPGGGVTYFTKRATVRPTGIEADLGPLGRIDVDYVPSGVRKRVHSRCSDDSGRFERASYVGAIEFHGEEGYTDVNVDRVPIDYSIFLDFLCAGEGFGETRGPGLPGARLRAATGRPAALDLEVRTNRPSAQVVLSVETRERRLGIEISRSVESRAPASSFTYDPRLRGATVDPPAPFAGSASFRRGARPANRWTGNLTVDLPGRANVALAAPNMRLSLVHARWTRAVTHFDRPRPR